MKNRKKAEALCLDIISKMLPNGDNVRLYKEKFASMSDKEFDVFIEELRVKKTLLCIRLPIGSREEACVSIRRNFRLMRDLGREPFTKINVPAQGGNPAFLTPKKYLVMPLQWRRQAQTAEGKISLPTHSRTTNVVTGQATGDSKGGRISANEMRILSGMGAEKILREFMAIRGGDAGGQRALDVLLQRQGTVSQREIEPYREGVQATAAMRYYFNAAHLKTTL